MLDGLEGVSATSGTGFDRAAIDGMLSRLSARVFLMNNVHDDAPILFHTRWALSYLRGPISRQEITALMAPHLASAPPEAAAPARFAPLPKSTRNTKRYATWQKALKTYLYQNYGLRLYTCAPLNPTSQADETEGAFRVRMREEARKARDIARPRPRGP